MSAPWRIEMLGWLRATRTDRVVSRFDTQKTAVLLAYLAYYRDRVFTRDELVELLWPECERDAGRHRLCQALFALRKQLEPSGDPRQALIITSRTTVRLHSSCITTDVAEFDALLRAAAKVGSDRERAQRLTEAVALYRGELLPGYFDGWILQERQWLAERHAGALSQLVAHLEQAGEWEQAIRYAERGVRADPLREEAHRDLMRLYAAAGQPAAALRQYQELERVLRQELAAAPDEATRALVAGLRRPAEDAAAVRSDPIKGPVPSPSASVPSTPGLEPVGGAVPVDSAFYVVRPTDSEFRAAIARRESIVLIKGAHQMGKSSLLVRGLQQAREAGARVALTDFDKLNAAHLESTETLLKALAQWLTIQLGIGVAPEQTWKTDCAPNLNFELFLRRDVLSETTAPMVWGLDGVDRLFQCAWASEVFGLLRSWYNERSLHPTGPWSRLTMAITYATEAHLFIRDLNQSPFNVGTRLALDDFTMEQVADLNRRYGAPLRDDSELQRFYDWLGGHPYLVRRGLHLMAAREIGIEAIETEADRETGIFGDHLRRLLMRLSQDRDLSEAMRELVQGRPSCTVDSFYRLRSAGVITGDSARDAVLRCRLYATYLRRHLL